MTWVRWAVAGLVLVLPLVLAPFGFQPFAPSKEFVLATGGIGIAFAFLITRLEAGDPPGSFTLRRGPLDILVAAFLLLSFISIAVAHNHAAAIGRLIVLLGGAGVFWVLSQDADSARTRRAVAAAAAAAATLVAAYAIGDFVGFLPSYRGRQYILVATLGNPNSVAEFLALGFPAGLAILLRVRASMVRGLLVAALVVQYAAILLSGSKGAWGAWVVGTTLAVVVLLVRDRGKLTHDLWVPVMALLILIESITLGRYVASVRVVPRGETGIAQMIPGRLEAPPEEWLSFRIRWGMTRSTLGLIRDHPILGVGVGNYFNAVQPYIRMSEDVLPPGNIIEHAHNDYLEILAELGPVGLLCFLGILAWAIRRTWQLVVSKGWPIEEVAAGLSFLTTFAANSLINFGLYEPVPGLLFWTTMGLAAASTNGQAGDKRWLVSLRPTRWPLRPLTLGLAVAYVGVLVLAVRPVVADAYVRRAVVAYGRSDFQAADRYLARALVVNPEAFIPRYIRMKVLAQQGRLAEVADVAREGIRRFPGAYLLHQALGEVLEGRGDLRAARAAHELALQLYPYFSAAVVGLGSVAEREGDLVTAVSRYEEALRLNPKQGLAWARVGILELRQGKVREAVGALRTARDLMPENSEVALSLGQAYLAAGDRLRGLMELDRARRMDPMNLEILQAWRAAMAEASGPLPPRHPPVPPPGRLP